MKLHPGEKFPEVMLDLGDHPPRPVPGGGLIPKAAVADQRGVARPAAGLLSTLGINVPLHDGGALLDEGGYLSPQLVKLLLLRRELALLPL
jgi:hypothetical protein